MFYESTLRLEESRVGLNKDVYKRQRKAREAGESKYPFTKMLSFSIDGITSFSCLLYTSAIPSNWDS